MEIKKLEGSNEQLRVEVGSLREDILKKQEELASDR